MTQPLQIRGTADLTYSYAVSSAYKSPWVYDPSGADYKDPDIWEVCRNQSDILAEVIRRNNQIVRPWRVAPNHHASYNAKNKQVIDDSKRLAALCHEGLSHCETLDESRVLLSEAFFTGRKYGMTLWEPVFTSLDGTPEMLWYLPYKIKDVDRRRMHWVPDWVYVRSDGKIEPAGSAIDYGNGRTVSQTSYPKGGFLKQSGSHLEMFDKDRYSWLPVSPEQRRNLIEYVYYDEEDRVGYGRGVLEAIYFTHYFLTGTFKKILEGIDRFANGVLIGTIDSLRNASPNKTNADVLTAMKNTLNTYRSEHYIALQDGDKIELMEATGTGMQISMTFVDKLVASVARLCNGSARPAGHSVDGTGSKAAAGVEEDTSESFYQPDRNALDHVLGRDLLGAFQYHNQDNIRALGLDKAKRPRFTSEQIKKETPEVAVSVMAQVLAAGQPILKSEYYDKAGLTTPAPDDEVVEGQSATMTDPLGFGGSPDDPFGFKSKKPGQEKPDNGKQANPAGR